MQDLNLGSLTPVFLLKLDCPNLPNYKIVQIYSGVYYKGTDPGLSLRGSESVCLGASASICRIR